jgi:uncharacterized protein YydD (DUF2326 family)
MKLNSLVITIDGESIRDIHFKDGLNLVTNEKGVGRSGNSVGKSTLSRVIDFIFMGSIDSIYIDEEFKKPNEDIKILFEKSIVVAELNFVGLDGKLHQVARNLCIDTNGLFYYIDGVKVDKKEYEKGIQYFFFNISTRRPSVRALVPKFIRNDSTRMLNTTKFLDKHSGNKEYSELFLYLFGFQNTSLLTQKRDASNLIKRRKRNSESLNAIIREQKPLALISEYKAQIMRLEEQFLKFDYSPNYNDPIAYLNELQIKEDSCSESLLNIKSKIRNIQKTIEMLSKEGGNYLSSELKGIYEFAGVSIESGIKKFEEVLSFHDNLVAKKRQYLSIDLPSLEKEKNEYVNDLNSIHTEKTHVFSNMRSREHINRITESLKEMGQLKISLGKYEGMIEQQKKATVDFESAKKFLGDILLEIEKEFNNIDVFEDKFNIEFKRISKLVFSDEYSFKLNFNKTSGDCKLEIINSTPNPEGGKKKAEVIAFDFAYIHAVDLTTSSRPSFIIHDSIEDIDQKQIDVLFEQARNLPGQQIISLLSENLSQEFCDKYEEDTVLLLSEKEMFFKV